MTDGNKQPHADELFPRMPIATADLLLEKLLSSDPALSKALESKKIVSRLSPPGRREFVLWLFTRCAFDEVLADAGINEARQAVQARLDLLMARIHTVDWNGSPSLDDCRMLAEAKDLYEALSPEAREEIPE